MRDLSIVNGERGGTKGLSNCLTTVNSTPAGVRAGGEECIGAHRFEGEQRPEVSGKGKLKSHGMSLPCAGMWTHFSGSGEVECDLFVYPPFVGLVLLPFSPSPTPGDT